MAITEEDRLKVLVAIKKRGAATKTRVVEDTSLPEPAVKACLGQGYADGTLMLKSAGWTWGVFWILKADRNKSVNTLWAESRRRYPELWPRKDKPKKKAKTGGVNQTTEKKRARVKLILSALAELGDGIVSSAVAAQTGIPLVSVQRYLKRMEKAKLVTSTWARGFEDERVRFKQWSLTKKGRKYAVQRLIPEENGGNPLPRVQEQDL